MNNVFFGQYRVWANLARFDRKTDVDGRKREQVNGEGRETKMVAAKVEGRKPGEGEKIIVRKGEEVEGVKKVNGGSIIVKTKADVVRKEGGTEFRGVARKVHDRC